MRRIFEAERPSRQIPKQREYSARFFGDDGDEAWATREKDGSIYFRTMNYDKTFSDDSAFDTYITSQGWKYAGIDDSSY